MLVNAYKFVNSTFVFSYVEFIWNLPTILAGNLKPSLVSKFSLIIIHKVRVVHAHETETRQVRWMLNTISE